MGDVDPLHRHSLDLINVGSGPPSVRSLWEELSLGFASPSCNVGCPFPVMDPLLESVPTVRIALFTPGDRRGSSGLQRELELTFLVFEEFPILVRTSDI